MSWRLRIEKETSVSFVCDTSDSCLFSPLVFVVGKLRLGSFCLNTDNVRELGIWRRIL